MYYDLIACFYLKLNHKNYGAGTLSMMLAAVCLASSLLQKEQQQTAYIEWFTSPAELDAKWRKVHDN